jgi:hypothetical protein
VRCGISVDGGTQLLTLRGSKEYNCKGGGDESTKYVLVKSQR